MLIARLAAIIALVAPAPTLAQDDAYYDIPLDQLTLTEGELPDPGDAPTRRWDYVSYMAPRVVLDDPDAEAYTAEIEQGRFGARSLANWRLRLRAPEGERITGLLIVPEPDYAAMVPLRFVVEPGDGDGDAQIAFLAAKRDHFENLQNRQVPGSAWFRYRAQQARASLGDDAPDRRWRPPGREFSDTFALFTGGRAIAENLQLDRLLPEIAPGARTIDVESIDGITIREYDWNELTAAIDPAIDPLANLIPADQHGVFFPSLAALMDVLDELEQGELPIFELTTPRPEDARTLDRYERQLGLSRSVLTRVLGPAFVRSVAMTGSDPYFPSGTDVAVLFEPVEGANLHDVLLAQVRTSAQGAPEVEALEGEIAGVVYRGWRTPDRTVCSYVADLGAAVVVTNSLGQLQRLASAQQAEIPVLASLDEYRFFRDRYRIGEADESAFLMLSDATIRRWAGPRWRIATARRMLASSLLADATARMIDEPDGGIVMLPASEHIDLGRVQSMPVGLVSSRFGSLEFLTPVAELDVGKATQAEASAYERWRDGYQRNWNWAFDPIAMRFSAGDDRLAADLTVMPLIVNTQYNTWLAISRGASIGEADPHDALLQFVTSINPKAPTMMQYGNMARGMLGLEFNPLEFIGDSLTLYADPDPFWAKLAEAEPGEAEDVIEEADFAVPIALHAEVKSIVRLTAFLAAVRGFIEQTTPNITIWETREHGGQSYVRVGLSETAKTDDPWDDVSIFYAAMPRALIVSPHEGVLQRAIDRQLARGRGGEPGDAAGAGEAGAVEGPWLGENLALNISADGWSTLLNTVEDEFDRRMQLRAWDNIPILNEWKRLRPDADPVAMHLEAFRTRLVDPGGGEYIWNERYRTMESTTYGHPGSPREGPALSERLRDLGRGRLGITFENDGLRARTELVREGEGE